MAHLLSPSRVAKCGRRETLLIAPSTSNTWERTVQISPSCTALSISSLPVSPYGGQFREGSGYLHFEADDVGAAIELASRIPAARMGGAIEVRPIVER
jgi:hypothetical protein